MGIHIIQLFRHGNLFSAPELDEGHAVAPVLLDDVAVHRAPGLEGIHQVPILNTRPDVAHEELQRIQATLRIHGASRHTSAKVQTIHALEQIIHICVIWPTWISTMQTNVYR